MKPLQILFRSMTAIPTAISLSLLSVSVFGQTSDEPAVPRFERQHQAGVRMGGWANQGGLPPAEFNDPDGGSVTTDIRDGSFYLEGYFAYRFSSFTQGELSFGFVNRGDVTTRFTNVRDVGTLNIYPILVQLKVYPPSPILGTLYPYLSAGGGIYYARNSVQISNDIFFANLRETSATDFNYTVGAGIDWPIANSVGLDVNVKYMPITFDDLLLEVRDWSAMTITVGAKYLYEITGKEEDNRRRRR